MTGEIIIAILGIIGASTGSICGVIMGSKIVSYRLSLLEKKCEKYDLMYEKFLVLEDDFKCFKERKEYEKKLNKTS